MRLLRVRNFFTVFYVGNGIEWQSHLNFQYFFVFCEDLLPRKMTIPWFFGKTQFWLFFDSIFHVEKREKVPDSQKSHFSSLLLQKLEKNKIFVKVKKGSRTLQSGGETSSNFEKHEVSSHEASSTWINSWKQCFQLFLRLFSTLKANNFLIWGVCRYKQPKFR